MEGPSKLCSYVHHFKKYLSYSKPNSCWCLPHLIAGFW